MVIDVIGLAVFTIVTVPPLILVQRPVPTVGKVAAMLKVLMLHFCWSTPALVVTAALLVKTTVALVVQAFGPVPFVTVQRSVTGLPVATFESVAEFELTSEILAEAKPTGLTTLQTPVPTEGAVAAKRNEPLSHFVCATPALAAATGKKLVRTTSSLLEHAFAPEPFVTVQRKVTELPAVKPKALALGLFKLEIEAPFAAPTTDHPPTAGDVTAFAASKKLPLLHFCWSTLALAVTAALLVKTTVALEEQTPVLPVPFVTVQRSVTGVPATTFETVALFELTLEILAVVNAAGLTTVQTPVPTEGVAAAKVNEGLLHCVMLGIAATETGALFVITTSSLEVQAPFVKVQRKVMGVPTGTFDTVIVLEVRLDKLVVANEEGLITVHAPDAGELKVAAFG